MIRKIMGSLVLLLVCEFSSYAQKILPDFTITKGTKNSYIISWRNNYGDNCVQISIQRSTDSLKNFRSIFTTPNPELPVNGYTDKLAPDSGAVFYRIFYTLGGGAYYFTPSHQWIPEPEIEVPEVKTVPKAEEKPIVPEKKAAPVVVPPKPKPELHVNISALGNIIVTLPNTDLYDYHMKIYREGEPKLLFEINRFDDNYFILDKGVFLKNGWYYYELYKKDKQIEKSRFQIGK